MCMCVCVCVFFFNDTATTEIYTLSLHDALPDLVVIDHMGHVQVSDGIDQPGFRALLRLVEAGQGWVDRKSTRLNSSH